MGFPGAVQCIVVFLVLNTITNNVRQESFFSGKIMEGCTNSISAQTEGNKKDTVFAAVAIGIISAELLLLEFFLSNALLSVDGYNFTSSLREQSCRKDGACLLKKSHQ